MDLDDIFPAKDDGGPSFGEDLSQHSVSELKGRIEALRAEISRVEKEIDTRSSVRSAAEDIFKTE